MKTNSKLSPLAYQMLVVFLLPWSSCLPYDVLLHTGWARLLLATFLTWNPYLLMFHPFCTGWVRLRVGVAPPGESRPACLKPRDGPLRSLLLLTYKIFSYEEVFLS